MLTMFTLVVIVFILVVVALLAIIFSEAKKGLYVLDNAKNQSADCEREPLQTETHLPIGPIEKIEPPWGFPSASEIIGEIGEGLIFNSLSQWSRIDGRYFRIAKNLYIPRKKGLSEIDVLLLHETGIYVIESKNLKGKIVGKKLDQEWDLFQRYNIHHTFRNPLMQNEGHICALKKFLGIDRNNDSIYNVVIFGKESNLEYASNDSKHKIVMTYYQISDKFINLIRNKKSCFNKNEIDKLSEKLMPCVNVPLEVKILHKKQITQQFGQKN